MRRLPKVLLKGENKLNISLNNLKNNSSIPKEIYYFENGLIARDKFRKIDFFLAFNLDIAFFI